MINKKKEVAEVIGPYTVFEDGDIEKGKATQVKFDVPRGLLTPFPQRPQKSGQPYVELYDDYGGIADENIKDMAIVEWEKECKTIRIIRQFQKDQYKQWMKERLRAIRNAYYKQQLKKAFLRALGIFSRELS